MMNEKWFGLRVEQIEKKLKTNAASGLSRKAARSRVNRAAGSLFYLPSKPSLRLLAELLSDFAVIILLLVAIVSLFFEERRNGIIVLVLLLTNLLVAWLLYYRAQRTVESLSSFFYPVTKVIRGGKLFHVDFRTVVPGDVILLEAGDVICCDARLVTSDSLTVRMRIDRDTYVSLEKLAEGHVSPNEHRAVEMVNMIHAGSVVEEGSARAIVTAVGKYTYLGAMTGGIALPVSEKMPDTLQRLRKHCSKINMIFLIAVLPFTLISLLFSHMNGGTVLLSSAFLTALSVVATTMSQLTCTLGKLFYIHKIRRLTRLPNPSVIKSVEALDQLASTDYVFLLDGCAVTDGILHFGTAACADGEIRNYRAMNATAQRFSELVSLYHTAATRTLTTGISGAGNYFAGIREFITKSGVDEGALQIRCSILSYAPGNMTNSAEQVYFVDLGTRYCLNVSRAPQSLENCNFVMIGGERQRLSTEGLSNLKSLWQNYIHTYQTPLIFTLSSDQGTDACFVGMLVLREGVDPNWAKNVTYLEKAGCRVISFANFQQNAPNIPGQMIAMGCVSKTDFVKRNLPLTYQFGKIKVYADFAPQDVVTLLNAAHQKGKHVTVVGFTDHAAELAKHADGFITCAPVHARTTGYFDEEIRTMELTGQQYSTSCTQTVKENADGLIPRPNGGKGGLASLATAVLYVKNAYQNLSDFLRYMLCTQIMRLLIVCIPMLFGRMILDARHVMLCSCIPDVLALLMFVENTDRIRGKREKNYCTVEEISAYFVGDKPMLISALVAGVSTVLLPELLGFMAIAGLYRDKVEYTITALLLLHLTALFWLRYGSNLKVATKFYRNKFFMISLAFSILFLILGYAWDAFGELFGMETLLSLPYLLLAILPSVLFSVIFVCFSRKKSKKPRTRT